MSSIQVECWNCGQKLNIRVDKIATARCGNCQQMVAKEEPPQDYKEDLPEDCYAILGVDENASSDEIKARFRFLSQAYHPDKFGSEEHRQNAENEFKRINQAYQTLSDATKRARYDATRSKKSSPASSPRPEPKPSPPAVQTEPVYEPPASKTQAQQKSSKIHSTRTITAKELWLVLGISIVISLVLKVIYAYVMIYSLMPIERILGGMPIESLAENRRSLFAEQFEFNNLGKWGGFFLNSVTLFLCSFLYLRQGFSRYRANIIAILVTALILNADWVAILVTFSGVIAMNVLTLWLFKIEEPVSIKRTDEWPEKIHQAKTGFGFFVIVLGALPITLISSYFLSYFVSGTLLLVASAVTNKNFFESIQTQPQLAKTGLYSVAAIIWFFMYRMSVRKGIRALKEGEGVFSALISAILDPIRFLPGGQR